MIRECAVDITPNGVPQVHLLLLLLEQQLLVLTFTPNAQSSRAANARPPIPAFSRIRLSACVTFFHTVALTGSGIPFLRRDLSLFGLRCTKLRARERNMA
jgi:hypothetical protein